jgi:AraC-like DNA-binding protein
LNPHSLGHGSVVSAVTLLGFEELVSELGGDVGALLAEVGLDRADLRKPDQFVPLSRTHELLDLAAERLRRKDLGLLWGARSDPSRLGPLYVALMNATSGRQAVEFLTRFLRLSFPTASVFLRKIPGRHDELLGIHNVYRHGQPMIQFYERRLGSLHVILKLVCGPHYKPREVWFAHRQNAAISAYQRVFGVRPQFEMPEYGLVIPHGILDATRPTNDQVREMALAYLGARSSLPSSSIKAEALHMVQVLMRTYNPGVSDTARALRLHPRTLQRRLRSEGISFDALKDDVRRSLAETLLAEPNMPLTEIALALHYANASAFTRSCQRWFGEPPTRVRRRLIARHQPSGARSRLRRARFRS